MKEIVLYRVNKPNLFVKVDDEDFYWLCESRWMAKNKPDGSVRVVRSIGQQDMARVLLGVISNGIAVNYKDGDPLNNQRDNLETYIRRAADRPFANNTSGYKGVTYNKAKDRYFATIMVNRKSIWLGSSVDPKICARSYNKKAIELFGPKAFVNDVEDGPTCENQVLTPTMRKINESVYKLTYKNNKSGFRGVHKDDYKWRAQIKSNGKVIYLGGFDSPEDAASAYDAAAKVYFGERARLNFPDK